VWCAAAKPTWEPKDNLTGCQEALDKFLKEHKAKPNSPDGSSKKRKAKGEGSDGTEPKAAKKPRKDDAVRGPSSRTLTLC
jgi:hypothetical protein